MLSNEEFTQKFINSLLPGNYFLTKSMELSKITTSGTLWYTKKFLVFYYYIFLADNITLKSDVLCIRKIFDDYIYSLPISVQEKAFHFFYTKNYKTDLRDDNFSLFTDFAGIISFSNQNERNDYYEIAKKYYFAFLMESGGQSGVKAHIKEKLYQDDFCFTQIDKIISDYYGDIAYNHVQVKNDYMAFLRNERQVLFYYGFFHSKSTGSSDKEFSSLTPIGELALKSNSIEFLAIWEHQKIKMVSQPVTIDIQNISSPLITDHNFRINLNPYLTILKWLQYKESFTNDEYQYIISRLHDPTINKSQINNLIKNIDTIKNKVNRFTRRADIASEDFQKELKKYLLGIRADLSLDNSTNPLSLCKLSSSKIEATDKELLKSLIELYTKLSKYKLEKYTNLFKRCQKEIRKQYDLGVKGQEYSIDKKTKLEWDMYNIHPEIPILLSIVVHILQSIYEIKFQPNTISSYADLMKDNTPNLLKIIGLYSKKSLINELKVLQHAQSTSNYEYYLAKERINYDLYTTKYITDSSQDLKNKIDIESSKPPVFIDGIKKRNQTLINLIKAYNKRSFSSSQDILKCECCSKNSFISNTNETFLEYHHLIPFNDYDGPDHYLNIYALCPMCHRKIHFIKQDYKKDLYHQISINNYIHKSLVQRCNELFLAKILRSYHLEFLLADDAITQDEYSQILGVQS